MDIYPLSSPSNASSLGTSPSLTSPSDRLAEFPKVIEGGIPLQPALPQPQMQATALSVPQAEKQSLWRYCVEKISQFVRSVFAYISSCFCPSLRPVGTPQIGGNSVTRPSPTGAGAPASAPTESSFTDESDSEELPNLECVDGESVDAAEESDSASDIYEEHPPLRRSSGGIKIDPVAGFGGGVWFTGTKRCTEASLSNCCVCSVVSVGEWIKQKGVLEFLPDLLNRSIEFGNGAKNDLVNVFQEKIWGLPKDTDIKQLIDQTLTVAVHFSLSQKHPFLTVICLGPHTFWMGVDGSSEKEPTFYLGFPSADEDVTMHSSTVNGAKELLKDKFGKWTPKEGDLLVRYEIPSGSDL